MRPEIKGGEQETLAVVSEVETRDMLSARLWEETCYTITTRSGIACVFGLRRQPEKIIIIQIRDWNHLLQNIFDFDNVFDVSYNSQCIIAHLK